MATRMVCIFIVSVIVLCSPALYGADIVNDLITAEVILDGMLHFEADQGILDYKVKVIETTDVIEKPEVVKVEKEIYFLAPNLQLTMIGGKPRSLQSDASFHVFLSRMFIEREKDTEINGVECFKIVATPREFAMEKYTKTYCICKEDFRKIRIESIRSEVDYNYIRYETDYYYDAYTDGENMWALMSSNETVAYDDKGNKIFEQVNDYFDYEIDIGLTQKDFETMLEDYKTYFSEGA